MSKNPEEITVLTPSGPEKVSDVETWWRDEGDLIVRQNDGEEVPFSLGEIIG